MMRAGFCVLAANWHFVRLAGINHSQHPQNFSGADGQDGIGRIG
jgi:hypothetical protein